MSTRSIRKLTPAPPLRAKHALSPACKPNSCAFGSSPRPAAPASRQRFSFNFAPGVFTDEAVCGLSRFAHSPKRLGAVSAAAGARTAVLPAPRRRAIRRDPWPLHARLSGAPRCAAARDATAARALIFMECGGLATAFEANVSPNKRAVTATLHG